MIGLASLHSLDFTGPNGDSHRGITIGFFTAAYVITCFSCENYLYIIHPELWTSSKARQLWKRTPCCGYF